MANLLGQNIGTNYKGILNLDSTINTPLDATLRAVTDGEGDASPLQLSTDAVGFTWAKARGTSASGIIDIYGTTTQDLQFWTADGGTRYGYITAQSYGIEFLASTSRYLSFGAGNAEGMRLTINRDLVIGTTTASARLHVKGSGTTSATTALLVQNSAGSNALQIRDDRVVIMEGIPTSSAGLPSGAIWNNSGVINIV
jgi:hypothetical protein